MNELFIIIPCGIVWAVIICYILGMIIISLYSRIMKKSENKTAQKNIASNKINDAHRIPSSPNVKQDIKSMLYGLARYYSILIGRIPSHHLRKILLRLCFSMEIHRKAVIYGGFEFRSPWNISIGNSVVGVGALLDGRCGIIIHDDVTLAQNVCIFTLQHDVNDPYFRTTGKGGTVEIKQYAWISSNCTILPKVKVNEGAVLASGAVATKDLAAYSINAGIPARKISERNRDLSYHTTNTYWHFY